MNGQADPTNLDLNADSTTDYCEQCVMVYVRNTMLLKFIKNQIF